MKFRIVLLSIEPLKASGTVGLTPSGRVSAWLAAATDSTYSVLAVGIFFYFVSYAYVPLAP